MKRGWDKPYPVMLVGGTDTFMVERELSRARQACVSTGRRYLDVDDLTAAEVSDMVSPSMFVTERLLVVVPAKVVAGGVLESIKSHHAEFAKAADVDVSFVVQGSHKDLAAVIGNGRVLSWEAPKPWQEREVAVKFLQAEVARLGATISEELATLMVRSAGTDRWLLTQEALKLVTYMQAVGREGMVAVREDAAAVTAPFAGGVVEDMVAAVAAGDRQRVCKAVTALSEGESPIAVCAAISSAASRWLYAASALSAGGVSDEDVASRLGQHVFVFRQNTLPHAKRWGPKSLTKLIKGLARVERSVKSGRISPWVTLESVLLEHCGHV